MFPVKTVWLEKRGQAKFGGAAPEYSLADFIVCFGEPPSHEPPQPHLQKAIREYLWLVGAEIALKMPLSLGLGSKIINAVQAKNIRIYLSLIERVSNGDIVPLQADNTIPMKIKVFYLEPNGVKLTAGNIDLLRRFEPIIVDRSVALFNSTSNYRWEPDPERERYVRLVRDSDNLEITSQPMLFLRACTLEQFEDILVKRSFELGRDKEVD